jgi:CHAD domain-containing protein
MSTPVVTERDARRFQAAKRYAELLQSPSWEQIKGDLERDVEKAMTVLKGLKFAGGKDVEHDILIEARTRLKLIKDIEARGDEYNRILERLSNQEGVKLPTLDPIAELPEPEVD